VALRLLQPLGGAFDLGDGGRVEGKRGSCHNEGILP
jgi:hypothetical protein